MIQRTPSGNKLTGFYLGKVLKHLSHGCIKAFIPSVYPESLSASPDQLPTCMQVVPQFAGNADGNGMFSYPNLGSTVVCFFANGDQNLPMTIGSVQGGNDAIHQYNVINQIDDYKTIESKLSSDKYVHDKTYEKVYDISSVSKLHRITAGKTSLTFFEHDDPEQGGVISSAIFDPIQTHVSALKPIDNKQDFVIYGADTKQCGTISAQTIDYVGKVKSEWLMNGEGTISAQTHDWNNNITSDCIMDVEGKVHLDTQSKDITCFIDMNTNGIVEIHTKSKSGHSYITMTSEGVMKIDTTDSLAVNTTNRVDVTTTDVTIAAKSSIAMAAPDITIDGSTLKITEKLVNINGNTTNINGDSISIEGSSITEQGSTVNINGSSGDCMIANTSLNMHIHKVPAHCPSAGITLPPTP